MTKIYNKIPNKVKKYIEKNNLYYHNEAQCWTDGFLFVAKKDEYINTYIMLMETLINLKKTNRLYLMQYANDFVMRMKQRVLEDNINHFKIIDETKDYIVFEDSVNLPQISKESIRLEKKGA